MRNEDSFITNKTFELRDHVSLYLGGYDMPPEVDVPAKGMPLIDKRTDSKYAELPWKDHMIAVREVLYYKDQLYKYRNTTEWLKEDLISIFSKVSFINTFDIFDIKVPFLTNLFNNLAFGINKSRYSIVC